MKRQRNAGVLIFSLLVGLAGCADMPAVFYVWAAQQRGEAEPAAGGTPAQKEDPCGACQCEDCAPLPDGAEPATWGEIGEEREAMLAPRHWREMPKVTRR